MIGWVEGVHVLRPQIHRFMGEGTWTPSIVFRSMRSGTKIYVGVESEYGTQLDGASCYITLAQMQRGTDEVLYYTQNTWGPSVENHRHPLLYFPAEDMGSFGGLGGIVSRRLGLPQESRVFISLVNLLNSHLSIVKPGCIIMIQ